MKHIRQLSPAAQGGIGTKLKYQASRAARGQSSVCRKSVRNLSNLVGNNKRP